MEWARRVRRLGACLELFLEGIKGSFGDLEGFYLYGEGKLIPDVGYFLFIEPTADGHPCPWTKNDHH